MSTFTFTHRLLAAMLFCLVSSLVSSPMLFWHWGTALFALAINAMVLWRSYRWVLHSVEEQHQYYLQSFRLQQESLETGLPAPMLKSLQTQDSFGEMAVAMNSLSTATSEQLSRLRGEIQSLQQNQRLFQSILGTMVEGVLVLDGDSRVLYFNQAARQVLGCTDRHVEGRPIWEVLRSSELNDVVEAVLRTGEEFRKEIELKRSKHAVEITAVQLQLPSKPGVVMVLHDVTELRGLERMRREFVSNVSHELKTPLTSIQVYADTLLDGGLGDAENNRIFVERILEQSDRLQSLIQDMLRLARIESQSEAFHLRPVSLAETLDACVDARQAVARSRNVTLRLQPGEIDVHVLVDPSGFQTIFDNLISNSINYSREGGWVEVRWRVENDEAIIEVQDNGLGIAAEHQDRVFERFYRIDKARSRGVGGTGLGLSIVKHLVMVFGGRIELESEAGTGSTFRITMPVSA